MTVVLHAIAFVIVAAAQRPAARASTVFETPAGRIEIESTNVNFGMAQANGPKEYPSAIVARVFSARPWVMRLIPMAPLEEERGEVIAWNRVEWRTRGVRYQPLTPQGTVVARGNATGRAGQLVAIDLRLFFSDSDPLGHFASRLQVTLDSL